MNLLDDDHIPVALDINEEIHQYGVQQGLKELRLRHRDGSAVYVETQGATIMSNGEPVANQGIARTLPPARKRRRVAFVDLRLNDIIEFIPDATLVIDRDGRVIPGTAPSKK